MGWVAAIPAIASGIGAIGSLFQGNQQARQANAAQRQVLRQVELENAQRAPMRRQGMQALGQIEAPIDLGNLGYNPANPFAAARGKTPSTATMGGWDKVATTPPAQIDLALSGLRPDELQFMNDALGAQLIGRSKGKQRFGNTGSGREYTNDDRNHAMMLRDRFQSQMGFTGMSPDQMMQRSGIQPLGRRG
ncbi:MAG: hypothetical protein KJT01_14795 [Gemmatimonadetes bacterium]|nr:hypothetical protein [Gemmatimonadota bacterium]